MPFVVVLFYGGRSDGLCEQNLQTLMLHEAKAMTELPKRRRINTCNPFKDYVHVGEKVKFLQLHSIDTVTRNPVKSSNGTLNGDGVLGIATRHGLDVSILLQTGPGYHTASSTMDNVALSRR